MVLLNGGGNNMRKINEITNEILADWKNPSPHTVPYLRAMHFEDYGLDGEKYVITRFLCNAQTWRGEKARAIKQELNNLIK